MFSDDSSSTSMATAPSEHNFGSNSGSNNSNNANNANINFNNGGDYMNDGNNRNPDSRRDSYDVDLNNSRTTMEPPISISTQIPNLGGLTLKSNGSGASSSYQSQYHRTNPNAMMTEDTLMSFDLPPDEGFAEPYRIDYILNVWKHRCSAEQKMLMAMQLLEGLSPRYLSQVSNIIMPKLHKDFISDLPFEIAVKILGMSNHRAVNNARAVSRYWQHLCCDYAVWKSLYESRNWEERLPCWKNINIKRILEEGRNYLAYRASQEERAVKDETSVFQHTSQKESSTRRQPFPMSDINQTIWHLMYKTHHWLEKRWENFDSVNSTYQNHTDAIYCLQFNEDILVTGSRDHTVKVWDLKTKEVTKILLGHTASVLCLQFDDDGNLITGSSDSIIRKWSLKTGELVKIIGRHDESVLNLRFDPNYLVTCSKDRLVSVWNNRSEDNEKVRILQGHQAAINSVAYEYPLVMSASGDRTVKIWNVETGDCLRTLEGHSRGIACLHAHKNRIVTGSSDKSIKVWDVEHGACLHTMVGHQELVRTVQIDNNRIVSGSYDRTIKIWDSRTGEKIKELPAMHESRVFRLQFNHKQLISSGQDGKAVFWELGKGLDPFFLS